ncbi:hypothetical protein BH09MYX1_BH09MYX1_14050 [soil metagenome]
MHLPSKQIRFELSEEKIIMRRLALALSLVSIVACGGTKEVAQATAPTCPPASSVAVASPVVTSNALTAPVVTSVSVKDVAVAKPSPLAAKSDATAQKLSITRIVIARDVKNRDPIDVGTRFDSSEPKVFAFVDVHNTEKLPGSVFVEFVSPKAGARGAIELHVGESDHYRTWAFTRLAKEPGTWTARIENERGEVLAEQSFEVFSID